MKEKVLDVLLECNSTIKNYTGNSMISDEVLDSFELLDLVSCLENAFNIEIRAKYMTDEYFGSVEAIVLLIEYLTKE